MKIIYWMIHKDFMKPVYVAAFQYLAGTPEQAYELADQCGEVSGDIKDYHITMLTETEWMNIR